jgi:hypothetical protein
MSDSAPMPYSVTRADHWPGRFLHVGVGEVPQTGTGLWLARRHARIANANQEDA